MGYKLLKVLGSGSFGSVYLAHDEKTGAYVAIKTVDLEQSITELDVVQKEVALMTRLQSNHTIRYYSSWCAESTLNIAMEAGLCSITDIISTIGPFNETTACLIMYNLVKGVAYLHESKVLHRDLKCANILITDESSLSAGPQQSKGLGGRLLDLILGRAASPSLAANNNSVRGPTGTSSNVARALSPRVNPEYAASLTPGIKLCDFGVSTTISSTMSKKHSFVGTPYWLSPELIQRGEYTSFSDIWAVGICLCELIFGHPPHHKLSPTKAMFRIVNESTLETHFEGKTEISKNCKDFAACCLDKQPNNRWPASKLLTHKWFKTIQKVSPKDVLAPLVEQHFKILSKKEQDRLCDPFAIKNEARELGHIYMPGEQDNTHMRSSGARRAAAPRQRMSKQEEISVTISNGNITTQEHSFNNVSKKVDWSFSSDMSEGSEKHANELSSSQPSLELDPEPDQVPEPEYGCMQHNNKEMRDLAETKEGQDAHLLADVDIDNIEDSSVAVSITIPAPATAIPLNQQTDPPVAGEPLRLSVTKSQPRASVTSVEDQVSRGSVLEQISKEMSDNASPRESIGQAGTVISLQSVLSLYPDGASQIHIPGAEISGALKTTSTSYMPTVPAIPHHSDAANLNKQRTEKYSPGSDPTDLRDTRYSTPRMQYVAVQGISPPPPPKLVSNIKMEAPKAYGSIYDLLTKRQSNSVEIIASVLRSINSELETESINTLISEFTHLGPQFCDTFIKRLALVKLSQDRESLIAPASMSTDSLLKALGERSSEQ